MRRTKDEAQTTRKEVLRSALQVFSEKGYAAATLTDIAERAHVTRGAIYWHFENKADLYNSLLAEYSALSSRIVAGAIEAGGTLPEILRRIFVLLLQEVERDPELRAAIELELFNTGRIADLEAGRQVQLEAGARLLEGIAGALREAIEAGQIRRDLEPLSMARSFLAFQNGVIRMWLTDPKSFSLGVEAETMAEIYLNGILGEGEEVDRAE